MAWEQGTANDYKDLLDKLRVFVTTHPDLVSAGQTWTQLRWSTAGEYELIIEGPGRPGAQPVTLGFRTASNTGIDSYVWWINGMITYVGSGEIADQPGASVSSTKGLNLWNSPIPYYFIANGARIMVMAQISTYFMFGYFGHIIPYAAPSEMPQPILVSGTSPYDWRRYSDSVMVHLASPYYTNYNSSSFSNDSSPAAFRRFDGAWSWWGSNANPRQSDKDNGSFDLSSDNDNYIGGIRMGEAVNGELLLQPMDIILPWDPSPEAIGVVGVLDGVYKTAPNEATPGSTVTVDGRTFLMWNNVWRIEFNDFIAMELI